MWYYYSIETHDVTVVSFFFSPLLKTLVVVGLALLLLLFLDEQARVEQSGELLGARVVLPEDLRSDESQLGKGPEEASERFRVAPERHEYEVLLLHAALEHYL